jgi:hypothetical protein
MNIAAPFDYIKIPKIPIFFEICETLILMQNLIGKQTSFLVWQSAEIRKIAEFLVFRRFLDARFSLKITESKNLQFQLIPHKRKNYASKYP